MHFLPKDAASFARIEDFDVNALAEQLGTMRAKYFVFTLCQNSGWVNAPNSAYDRITGYKPGERCAMRDLPLELHRALSSKGIRLMLYLPCQVPNRDSRAQKAFGLEATNSGGDACRWWSTIPASCSCRIKPAPISVLPSCHAWRPA